MKKNVIYGPHSGLGMVSGWLIENKLESGS